MAGIYEEARAEAGNAARTVLCGLGGLARLQSDFFGKGNPLFPSTQIARWNGRIASGLQSFCPVPAPPASVPPIPFSGGQCPLLYTVFIDYQTANEETGVIGQILNSGFGNIQGPIGGFTYGPARQANPRKELGTLYQSLRISYAGVTNGNLVALSNPLGIRRLLAVRVVPPSGQLDNCGDAPPSAPSPHPPSSPNPPPVTRNITLAPSVTVPIVFTPIVGIVNVDARGYLSVPVKVQASFTIGGVTTTNNFDFDVNLEDPTLPPTPVTDPYPELPDGRPNPPDSLPPPRTTPPKTPPVDPDIPPIDDPADDPAQEVKAARVATTVPAGLRRVTEILWKPGNPIYAPRLGSFRWKWIDSSGNISYSEDIDLKTGVQLFIAPEVDLECLGGEVVVESGVVADTTFYYGPICRGC